MTTFLILKWIHILSSVVLVGVGFGSAFYLFFTNRTRNVAAIAEVSRLVVRADFWFTCPTIIIQPLTGFAMATMLDYPLSLSWLLVTYALFLFAGVMWLPVVWIQIKMAEMAKRSYESNMDLPELYWRYSSVWTLLGGLAFPAMITIFGLMVFKPDLV